MKRSHQVPASLVVAIAASITAAGCDCGTGYVDQCVDSLGRVLPDAACHGGGGYYYNGTYYSGVHYIHVQSGGFGGAGGGGGWGGVFGGG